MATIYDVAKAAGVSPKTVSRVLNRDAPVGADTRDKVERAISRLGYVPSNAARMMRSPARKSVTSATLSGTMRSTNAAWSASLIITPRRIRLGGASDSEGDSKVKIWSANAGLPAFSFTRNYFGYCLRRKACSRERG